MPRDQAPDQDLAQPKINQNNDSKRLYGFRQATSGKCECPLPAPRIQLREAREWPAFGRASTDGTAVRSQGIETADGWAPRQESGHKKASPKPGFFLPWVTGKHLCAAKELRREMRVWELRTKSQDGSRGKQKSPQGRDDHHRGSGTGP